MKLSNSDKEQLKNLLNSAGWEVLVRETKDQLGMLRQELENPVIPERKADVVRGQIIEKVYILEGIIKELGGSPRME